MNTILGERKPSRCCYLLCNEEAEWEIVSGPSSDDVTEACTKHVGDLLTDAATHYIYRISGSSEIKEIQNHRENCALLYLNAKSLVSIVENRHR